MKNKILLKNTIMLYLMTFTKMFLPLLTLPYLTRILTTDSYGVVSYVKSVMTYMQIIVDFGFMLSITKEIIKFRDNKVKLSELCSDTLLSRLLLWILAFLVLIIMSLNINILGNNFLYVGLSMISIFLTCFLPDYLFRGLEVMEILTYRFIISKVFSTILTFLLVKSDATMLWIPILDILGNFIAILLTYYELDKMKIKIVLNIKRLHFAFSNILKSANYFASNLASTLLGAFSTILIGVYLLPTDVAFWSLSNSLIGTVQTLYNPISDGIYPQMIKYKNINLIKNIMKIFLPIIFIGCIISYFIAPTLINIISGPKYTTSVDIFRLLIPILFFSFLSIILGWPSLGAINKSKETMITTIIAATVQIVLFFFLIVTQNFSVWTIALVRIISEIILMSTRFFFVYKYKNQFEREKTL